jgi:hypothetical protein
MASTYTTNLGLTLPTTGELAGTWGSTVNTGVTELLDSSIAGTTTLSADADVTLSVTDGAANQARSAVILWTASNGATPRNITVPSHTKAYIVINAGTGSIVVKGAATTGVTIATGVKALIAWNGSDFVVVAASVMAVGGITGLGTGVATALAVNVGSAGAPVVFNGAGGTPSSITLTNGTGLPAAGVTGTAVTQTTLNNATLPASFTTLSASGSIQGQASHAFKMNSNSGQYYHFDNASGNNFMGLSAASVVNLYAGGALSSSFTSTGLSLGSLALTAGSGTFSDDVTVGGSLVTSGVAGMPNLALQSTTNGRSGQITWQNTGATNIAAAYWYGSVFYLGPTTAQSMVLRAGSGDIATVSSTGLAVTGALSATGNISATDAAGVTATDGTRTIGMVADYTGGQATLYSAGNYPIYFRVNGNIVGNIGAAGLAPTGLLDLSAATAGQIKFPATQNASSDANTLDDYERGTYTPSAGGFTIVLNGGSVSYSGTYKKVGNLVKVTARIVANGGASVAASTGAVDSLSVPFTAAGNDCGTWVNSGGVTTSGQVYIATNGYMYICTAWSAVVNGAWVLEASYQV